MKPRKHTKRQKEFVFLAIRGIAGQQSPENQCMTDNKKKYLTPSPTSMISTHQREWLDVQIIFPFATLSALGIWRSLLAGIVSPLIIIRMFDFTFPAVLILWVVNRGSVPLSSPSPLITICG